MRPVSVSAGVGFLGHATCTVTGKFLITAGGRLARRVFDGTVGYVNLALAVEDVSLHLQEMLDDRRYLLPKVGVAATAAMATTLGFDLGTKPSIAGSADAGAVNAYIAARAAQRP